jgi:hypothetical protein
MHRVSKGKAVNQPKGAAAGLKAQGSSVTSRNLSSLCLHRARHTDDAIHTHSTHITLSPGALAGINPKE